MTGKPHGRDLRKGRFSEAGQVYLLTAVTYERRPLFEDWLMGRLLVAEFRGAAQRGDAQSLAWVVMPDHFHWLVELRGAPLDRLMLSVKSRSALALNRARGSRGAVWQRGYHDHALRKEEDVQEVARYIVANPLRAGLVRRIGDYPLWDAVWL